MKDNINGGGAQDFTVYSCCKQSFELPQLIIGSIRFNCACLDWGSEISEFHGTASYQQSPTDGTKFVALRPKIQSRRWGDILFIYHNDRF